MGKYKDLVEDHLNARIVKNKVASDVLGTLKGEVETALKGSDRPISEDEVVENMAKSMVKGLEIVGGEQSKTEIDILQPYLPQTMTKEQIKEVLEPMNLSLLGNLGAKIGRAMSVLKGRADGNDVRNVIQEFYN